MLIKYITIINNIEELSESEFLYRKDIPKNIKQLKLYNNYEKQLKEQEEQINKELNLTLKKEKIYSINNKDIYDKFLKYISLNINDYLINGKLGIEFQIRYFACCFIIIFIPGEIGFFFPAQIIKWIPKKLKLKKFISNFILETELFFKFIKIESSSQFLINVIFGRSNSLFKDIEDCVYAIRDLIKFPEKSIKTLLDFQIRSIGYNEFKEKQLKN